MNNLENNGESLLRDKLLQHQFAEDDRDWAKMDDLLNAQLPPAPPPPAAPAGLHRTFGGQWLLGFLGLGLTAWWLLSLQPVTSAYPAVATSTADRKETSQAPAGARLPLESTGIATVVPTDDEPYSTVQTTKKETMNPPFKAPAAGVVNAASAVPASSSKSNENQPVPIMAGSNPGASKEPGHNDRLSPVNLDSPVSRATGPASGTGIANTVDQTAMNVGDKTAPAGADEIAQPASPIPALVPLPQRSVALSVYLWPSPAEVPWPKPYRGKRIHLGVVGGVQLAYTPNGRYSKMTIGPTFGLSAKYQLSPRWALQADLLYRSVQYNLEASFSQNRLDANGSYSQWQYSTWSNDLEFFEMPLLARRTLLQGRVGLLGGLRPALVRSLDTYSGTGGTYTGSNPYTSFASFQPTAQDGVRRFDLALALGADVRLSRKFWLDVRFNQGLLDLTHDDFFQNSNTDVSTDAQVTLRYYFLSF